MKKLSAWASHHKWAARIIIICIYPMLNALAAIAGILLFQLNIELPLGLMIAAILICVGAIVYYPRRSDKYVKFAPAAFYLRQKSCDFLLGLTTFLMVMFVINRLNTQLPFYEPLMGASTTETSAPKDSTLRQYKTIQAFSATMKDEKGKALKWKERKKLLKKQLRAIENDDELSDGAKFFLIFLSCVVATGLLILLAALACEISCSGSEALAILVMLLGTGLLVFLLIRVIKRILGKSRKKKETPPAEPEKN